MTKKKKKKKQRKGKKPVKAQLQQGSAHFVIAKFTAHLFDESIEIYTYKFTRIATVHRKEQKRQKPTEPFWTTDPNSMLQWPTESIFLPQIDQNMTFASYSKVLSKPHRPLEENTQNSQLFRASFYQPVLLTALTSSLKTFWIFQCWPAPIVFITINSITIACILPG